MALDCGGTSEDGAFPCKELQPDFLHIVLRNIDTTPGTDPERTEIYAIHEVFPTLSDVKCFIESSS